MANTVTWETLRELARFRSQNDCAISLYVGLDPSEAPTSAQIDTKFNSLISEAEKEAESHGGSRDCKLALRADLERIREWWDDEFERDGAQGLALFASSGDDFFRPLPLSVPVNDDAQVDAELYLAPLAAIVGRGDGALVAVVSREQGMVYRLTGGRLVEVADESKEQPGQHDQGGWSQARYQRHLDDLVQHHLKAVGGEIAKRVRGRGDLKLVVVAPDEMRSELESALSDEVRRSIVGWANAEAHAAPAKLLEIVQPLLDEADARVDQEALEHWQEDRGRGSGAAAGWAETLEAASDARVDTLLLEEGADRPAWQCPKCGRSSAAEGQCALDGTTLERREHGADQALRHVLRNGGSFVTLGAGALGDAEGIGALLRY